MNFGRPDYNHEQIGGGIKNQELDLTSWREKGLDLGKLLEIGPKIQFSHF